MSINGNTKKHIIIVKTSSSRTSSFVKEESLSLLSESDLRAVVGGRKASITFFCKRTGGAPQQQSFPQLSLALKNPNPIVRSAIAPDCARNRFGTQILCFRISLPAKGGTRGVFPFFYGGKTGQRCLFFPRFFLTNQQKCYLKYRNSAKNPSKRQESQEKRKNR